MSGGELTVREKEDELNRGSDSTVKEEQTGVTGVEIQVKDRHTFACPESVLSTEEMNKNEEDYMMSHQVQFQSPLVPLGVDTIESLIDELQELSQPDLNVFPCTSDEFEFGLLKSVSEASENSCSDVSDCPCSEVVSSTVSEDQNSCSLPGINVNLVSTDQVELYHLVQESTDSVGERSLGVQNSCCDGSVHSSSAKGTGTEQSVNSTNEPQNTDLDSFAVTSQASSESCMKENDVSPIKICPVKIKGNISYPEPFTGNDDQIYAANDSKHQDATLNESEKNINQYNRDLQPEVMKYLSDLDKHEEYKCEDTGLPCSNIGGTFDSLHNTLNVCDPEELVVVQLDEVVTSTETIIGSLSEIFETCKDSSILLETDRIQDVEEIVSESTGQMQCEDMNDNSNSIEVLPSVQLEEFWSSDTQCEFTEQSTPSQLDSSDPAQSMEVAEVGTSCMETYVGKDANSPRGNPKCPLNLFSGENTPSYFSILDLDKDMEHMEEETSCTEACHENDPLAPSTDHDIEHGGPFTEQTSQGQLDLPGQIENMEFVEKEAICLDSHISTTLSSGNQGVEHDDPLNYFPEENTRVQLSISDPAQYIEFVEGETGSMEVFIGNDPIPVSTDREDLLTPGMKPSAQSQLDFSDPVKNIEEEAIGMEVCVESDLIQSDARHDYQVSKKEEDFITELVEDMMSQVINQNSPSLSISDPAQNMEFLEGETCRMEVIIGNDPIPPSTDREDLLTPGMKPSAQSQLAFSDPVKNKEEEAIGMEVCVESDLIQSDARHVNQVCKKEEDIITELVEDMMSQVVNQISPSVEICIKSISQMSATCKKSSISLQTETIINEKVVISQNEDSVSTEVLPSDEQENLCSSSNTDCALSLTEENIPKQTSFSDSDKSMKFQQEESICMAAHVGNDVIPSGEDNDIRQEGQPIGKEENIVTALIEDMVSQVLHHNSPLIETTVGKISHMFEVSKTSFISLEAETVEEEENPVSEKTVREQCEDMNEDSVSMYEQDHDIKQEGQGIGKEEDIVIALIEDMLSQVFHYNSPLIDTSVEKTSQMFEVSKNSLISLEAETVEKEENPVCERTAKEQCEDVNKDSVSVHEQDHGAKQEGQATGKEEDIVTALIEDMVSQALHHNSPLILTSVGKISQMHEVLKNSFISLEAETVEKEENPICERTVKEQCEDMIEDSVSIDEHEELQKICVVNDLILPSGEHDVELVGKVLMEEKDIITELIENILFQVLKNNPHPLDLDTSRKRKVNTDEKIVSLSKRHCALLNTELSYKETQEDAEDLPQEVSSNEPCIAEDFLLCKTCDSDGTIFEREDVDVPSQVSASVNMPLSSALCSGEQKPENDDPTDMHYKILEQDLVQHNQNSCEQGQSVLAENTAKHTYTTKNPQNFIRGENNNNLEGTEEKNPKEHLRVVSSQELKISGDEHQELKAEHGDCTSHTKCSVDVHSDQENENKEENRNPVSISIVSSSTHDEAHGLNQLFLCRDCSQKFSTLVDLSAHVDVHKAHACDSCDLKYRKYSNLCRHASSHTGKQAYICELCDKAFESHDALDSHRKKECKYPIIFHCESCEATFQELHVYQEHMSSHSNVDPFFCEECMHTFRKYLEFHIHMQEHTNERKFKCDLCASSFVIKTHLSAHKRKQHKKGNNNSTLTCHLCEKAFEDPSRLRRHVLGSHSRYEMVQKAATCEYCATQFKSTRLYLSHMHNICPGKPKKSQPGTKSKVSNPKTSKTSQPGKKSKVSSPEKSKATQPGTKGNVSRQPKTPCPVCNQMLANRSNLKRHLLVWHGLDASCKSETKKMSNKPISSRLRSRNMSSPKYVDVKITKGHMMRKPARKLHPVPLSTNSGLECTEQFESGNDETDVESNVPDMDNDFIPPLGKPHSENRKILKQNTSMHFVSSEGPMTTVFSANDLRRVHKCVICFETFVTEYRLRKHSASAHRMTCILK